jgi:transglutaminase-like putative cysteine protease
MPQGLRAAYLIVLGPPALLAPFPLFWTHGASPIAIALYESALILLFVRARAGRPVRLSDAVLNAIGLSYFFWLAIETALLRPGLLRSVSHLLLFTTIAKLASLKRPGEARTALLVLFLLVLAAISSSTHVASLLYCAAMGVLGFRTLSRLAVLADFDEGPPARVLTAVPTAGLSAAALLGGVLLAVPLFFLLPRLHGPYALSPIRLGDSPSTAVTTDRVDLDSFGGAKQSERVVLRLSIDPPVEMPELLRLREAVFTQYRNGVWTRSSHAAREVRGSSGLQLVSEDSLPSGDRLAHLSVDQNFFGSGFLFLPYRASHVRVERGRPVLLADGSVQVSSTRTTVRYEVSVAKQPARGAGRSAIDPAQVPPEIRDYAWKLTAELTDPARIAERIVTHFRKGFVYTLEPPKGSGDPLTNFLLRSKAGHCEYFASAAAMMLASRGVRARLVTGSYGGEVGAFSDAIVVRGANLHAWVEADLDGTGFQVVEPTPPAGVPPATAHVSWWRRFVTVGREIEVFYDRRILGFDSGDQVQLAEVFRDSFGNTGRSLKFWKGNPGGGVFPGGAKVVVVILGLAALGLFALRGARRRPAIPPATRAYIALRRTLARRVGSLAPAVPPAEVVRLLASSAPGSAEDARAVVQAYCESAFGGRATDPSIARELGERMKRLKRLKKLA